MTGCQGAPHGRQAGRGGGEPSRWRGCLGRLQGDTEVKAVTLSSPDCKGLDQTRLQQYSVRTFCPSRPGLPALQYTWETPNLILPMKASGTHSPGGQLPGTPHSRSIRQRRKCWQGGHNEAPRSMLPEDTRTQAVCSHSDARQSLASQHSVRQ